MPRIQAAAAIPEHRETRLCSKDVLVILILFVLIVAIWLPRIAGPIDLRWDGGTYYILGTALAEGKGYRLLNEPGEIEAIQYPPLLPAIVAAHQLMLGTNDPVVVGVWLRRSFFLIFTAYILLTYLMLRIYLRELYAFLATLVCLGHLYTNFLSDVLFAEIPFALATLLFMLIHRSGGQARTALAGVFAVISYLLRTTGVCLFAAWIGESVFRRAYQQAAVRLILAALPILVWQAYIAHVESSPSYSTPAYSYQRADYLFYNVSYAKNLWLRDPLRPELGKASKGELFLRVTGNVIELPISLGEAISASRAHWQTQLLSLLPSVAGVAQLLTNGVVLALGSLVVLGTIMLFARGYVLVGLYIFAYMAAVCLTPWPDQWLRYWVPLTPFLALALCQSLWWLHRKAKTAGRAVRTMVWSIPIATLCIVFSIELTALVQIYNGRGRTVSTDRHGVPVTYHLFFYDHTYKALDAGLDWLKPHARVNDIVAVSMPHWAYLRTGLRAVMPPFEADAETIQARLDSVPVKFVIVDQTNVNIAFLMRQQVLPLMQSSPDRWRLLYTAPSGLLAIYERVAEHAQ